MSGFFGREGLGLCLVPLVENSTVMLEDTL